jgi:hypothetical protein
MSHLAEGGYFGGEDIINSFFLISIGSSISTEKPNHSLTRVARSAW